MSVETDARLLWNYHLMHHSLEKADCVIALGSHDLRVAARAAELYHQGWAPYIVFSGGLGRLTSQLWSNPEAELFAEIAVKEGVPADAIILEKFSTNTGENILFTRKLLVEKGLNPLKAISVHKPYMERRTYATFRKLWPDLEILVTSPKLSFDEYCTKNLPEGMNLESIINIMVGDLQRIREYPAKGFQIEQHIPSEVWTAFTRLVKCGYDKHLVNKISFSLTLL